MSAEPITVEETRSETSTKFFVKAPLEIVNNRSLTSNAKIVYLSLLGYCGTKDYCFVKQTTISENTGIPYRTVKRSVQELKDADLIEVTRTKNVATTKVKKLCETDTNLRIIPSSDGGKTYRIKEANMALAKGRTGPYEGPDWPLELSRYREQDQDNYSLASASGESLAPNANAQEKPRHQTSSYPLVGEGGLFARLLGWFRKSELQEQEQPNSLDSKTTVPEPDQTNQEYDEEKDEPVESGFTGAGDCSSGRKEIEMVQEVYADDSPENPRRKKKKSRGGGKRRSNAPFILWRHWRKNFCATYGGNITEDPMGSDIGHMKNIHKFCAADLSMGQKMIDKLFAEWDDVRAIFPVAKNKPLPTTYLLDTLKDQLYAACVSEKTLSDLTYGESADNGDPW